MLLSLLLFRFQTAGTETTTLTLHWAVAALAEHPEIQERIAQEIDDVIGRDRLPSLDDKGTLPYTEATLLELLRYGSVVPLGVPHAVLTDTSLSEYPIDLNGCVRLASQCRPSVLIRMSP